MKNFLIFIGIFFLTWACSAPKGIVSVEKSEAEILEADSLEYDVETFDNKFESWYLMHKSPANYRSQDYYENWNRQYVLAWNSRATNARRNTFFEPIVGYDPNTDYGFDVNHELFYYFQYVENVLKIKILQGGPKVVPF